MKTPLARCITITVIIALLALLSCEFLTEDPLEHLSGTDDPLYVAVGNSSGTKATVLISLDGNSWSNIGPNVAGTPNLNGIAYGNGRFVAVGTNGTSFSIYFDRDGIFSSP